GDIAHLSREVARHEVDAVGKILPGPGHTLYVGLSAEAPFGAYFPRHARHFGGKRAQLVDHGVDGGLELETFAFDVNRDLLRQVSTCHRFAHVGDVAHLPREIARHEVDAIG